MSSPEQQDRPSTKTRRERGVLAQREYRKRHAGKFKLLQEENSRLKDALESIIAVTDSYPRIKQWPELSAALSQAKKATGICRSAREGGRATGDSDNHSSLSERPVQARNDPDSQIHGWLERESFHETMPTPMPNFGTWLDTDPVVRTFNIPPHIRQFLGEGLSTLSSCIYWGCTSHALYLWDKMHNNPDRCLAEKAIFDRMFSSDHITDRAELMNLAKAGLDFRRNGCVALRASDLKTLEAPKGQLALRIETEQILRGSKPEWWKTPQDIEGFARDRLTEDEVRRMHECIEGRGTPGDIGHMKSFLKLLAESFICFGDGPRWNLVSSSLAVGMLIKNFRGENDPCGT